MDDAQRILAERLYARRMATRRLFLSDPRNARSAFTKDGRLLIAHLARHCHVMNPIHTNDPIELARINGMQKTLALLLGDIFEDLPNFAQMMADEEAREADEIMRTA